jgi:transcriptional regulator GlxA family with amidase domain
VASTEGRLEMSILSSQWNAEAHAQHLLGFLRNRFKFNARDLISEWPHDFMCIAVLCRELGVSQRALQQSFQEMLGVKSSAYIRAVRMNGARRAIKTASSVAEAATLWGFWHFGRFARDYNTMFRELPSEAIRGALKFAPKVHVGDSKAIGAFPFGSTPLYSPPSPLTFSA